MTETTFHAVPACPACKSSDLRTEDVKTGRHQCRRSLWRCVVNPNGTVRDMIDLAAAGRGGRARRPTPTQRRGHR